MSMHKQQSLITRSLQSWLAGSEHSHMRRLLMCDFCLSLHQVLMAVCLVKETDSMTPLSPLLSSPCSAIQGVCVRMAGWQIARCLRVQACLSALVVEPHIVSLCTKREGEVGERQY